MLCFLKTVNWITPNAHCFMAVWPACKPPANKTSSNNGYTTSDLMVWWFWANRQNRSGNGERGKVGACALFKFNLTCDRLDKCAFEYKVNPAVHSCYAKGRWRSEKCAPLRGQQNSIFQAQTMTSSRNVFLTVNRPNEENESTNWNGCDFEQINEMKLLS